MTKVDDKLGPNSSSAHKYSPYDIALAAQRLEPVLNQATDEVPAVATTSATGEKISPATRKKAVAVATLSIEPNETPDGKPLSEEPFFTTVTLS
jgi:hypothetical protein